MIPIKTQLEKIRHFYDSIYYQDLRRQSGPSRHFKNLSAKMNVGSGMRVLDVACGSGQWLEACTLKGAVVHGVDISLKAISDCRLRMPEGQFFSGPAESLPFGDQTFDLITCLGALEHFVDPKRALQEISRVSKPDAKILLLVPNADFLTRKLGLFSGTYQVDAKEEVLTLNQWKALFESQGLIVRKRWRDLHVLSRTWICRGHLPAVALRFFQALVLTVWPLQWQYQVYHLCQKID
jgi:ubiquinone/menaquinone biosynthesis C-methylase UbiE